MVEMSQMCCIWQLNLDRPGVEETLLLLAIYEETRANHGKIQSPASAQI